MSLWSTRSQLSSIRQFAVWDSRRYQLKNKTFAGNCPFCCYRNFFFHEFITSFFSAILDSIFFLDTIQNHMNESLKFNFDDIEACESTVDKSVNIFFSSTFSSPHTLQISCVVKYVCDLILCSPYVRCCRVSSLVALAVVIRRRGFLTMTGLYASWSNFHAKLDLALQVGCLFWTNPQKLTWTIFHMWSLCRRYLVEVNFAVFDCGSWFLLMKCCIW